MRLDEPRWWYEAGRRPLIARALAPVSALYARVVEHRFDRAKPYRSSLPVICIGNLTVGGTGKTPFAMRVAEELRQLGELPVFLTRGYGGRIQAPHWVDPDADTARAVGDEPLLLARVAPTVVSKDRAAGAQAIEETGRASVIVMDDGLQNPSLAKDFTIAVLDHRRGIGNGMVFPAGPLRARLAFQLNLVDAIVLNSPPGDSDGPGNDLSFLRSRFSRPVIRSRPEPSGNVDWLRGARVVAFAGIANPQRFFRLLETLGAQIAAVVQRPDHHFFDHADANEVLDLATNHNAIPVTTEKDWVRLGGGSGAIAELKQRSRALPIRATLDETERERLSSLLQSALRTARQAIARTRAPEPPCR